MLPYKDSLLLFSRYLQQLVMESLGKEFDLDGNKVNLVLCTDWMCSASLWISVFQLLLNVFALAQQASLSELLVHGFART